MNSLAGCRHSLVRQFEDFQLMHRQMADLVEVSKQKLADELDVPHNHPKFDHIWDRAWDMGHTEGLPEIEQHFREVVKLLRILTVL